MRNKAYIVANKQQEREVLDKLEQQGLVWNSVGEKPTEWVPSHDAPAFIDFPIILTDKGRVSWAHLSQLDNEEIVYDGRNKYIVSQEFMNELEEWKDDIRHEWFDKKADGKWLNSADISDLESITEDWWLDTEISCKENNNRLIAIIRWLNGEDVFEVEKPKKWVVRSKNVDSDGETAYVDLVDNVHAYVTNNLFIATRFDTKEEAQSWANSHQEVVEVGE